MFGHGLKGHKLFELNSLVELCDRMPDHGETYWSNGKVDVTASWETATAARQSLLDTVANIARNNSLVILKHTEQDPVHGPVLRELLTRFVEFCGARMRGDAVVGEALILISSPNRLTPYHMDGETNFLVQVAGDKTLNVFNHLDRTLITHEEQEDYHLGNHSSAVYREERQKDATVFDLRAGYGVHIPPASPHWVRNGDNVSVALSINYELRSVEKTARIYRLNRRLRKLGLTPVPPGVSAWRDQAKLAALAARDGVARIVRPRSNARESVYPVWVPPG
jgi:hypothetical protein